MMEYDVHTLLDLLTLIATVWVLYTMRTKLARSYNARKDTTQVELIVRAICCRQSVPMQPLTRLASPHPPSCALSTANMDNVSDLGK